MTLNSKDKDQPFLFYTEEELAFATSKGFWLGAAMMSCLFTIISVVAYNVFF